MNTNPIEAPDWLGNETERNKANADIYTELVKRAYGCNEAVLIGHHICFEKDNDIATENEIPAADSLLFDHAIMTAVFAELAIPVMATAATFDAATGERDAFIRDALEIIDADKGETSKEVA